MYNQPYMQQPIMNQQQYYQQIQQQQMEQPPEAVLNPTKFNTPTITTDGGMPVKFTIKDNNHDLAVPVTELTREEEEVVAKKRGRKKKTESGEIVRSEPKSEQLSGTVEESPTAYTYMETTGLLRETLNQIDSLNSELMQEFTAVRHNRTMKNKYNTLVGISENVGSLLSNRIAAIREINSSISKANEMDYKKAKDLKAAMADQNDDKYIADLYKSYISNPMNVAPQVQMPNVDPAIFGSGIVRADLGNNDPAAGGNVDASYLNYLSNLSPEENLMRYEGNPSVKQVVVFDAASGNKFFQMMDLSTGQVIPNVPVYDQMFMEDTTIDLDNKIAKNINLNESFPVVVINEGVTSNY